MTEAMCTDTGCLKHDKTLRSKTEWVKNQCRGMLPKTFISKFEEMLCPSSSAFENEWGEVDNEMHCKAVFATKEYTKSDVIDEVFGLPLTHILKKVLVMSKDLFPSSSGCKMIFMLYKWIESAFFELVDYEKYHVQTVEKLANKFRIALIFVNGRHFGKFDSKENQGKRSKEKLKLKEKISRLQVEKNEFMEITRELAQGGRWQSHETWDVFIERRIKRLVQYKSKWQPQETLDVKGSFPRTPQEVLGGVTSGSNDISVNKRTPQEVPVGDEALPNDISVKDPIQALQAAVTVNIPLQKNGRLFRHEYVNDADQIGTQLPGKNKSVIKVNNPDSLGGDIVLTHIFDKNSNKWTEERLSKLYHFGIVPLLAFSEIENKVQLFFPYPSEGRDLRSMIKRDRTNVTGKKLELNMNRKSRLRILYHVASAIKYLHSKTLNKRKEFLYMDINSSNIVVDADGNARLIDLGITDVGEGMFHSRNKTKHIDVGNFGIVIRELLTGQDPFEKMRNKQLKDASHEDLVKYIQTDIWPLAACKQHRPVNSGDSVREPVESEKDKKECDNSGLLDLSQRCIENAQTNTAASSFTIADVVKTIETLVRDNKWQRSKPEHNKSVQTPEPEQNKCEVCTIHKQVENPMVLNSMCGAHLRQCDNPIAACIVCMRHSFMNPIICHSCEETVIPPIGSDWGAILIAGNDVEDNKNAETFHSDITNLQGIFTDKHLPIMALCEDMVKVVHPTTPGKTDDLLPKLEVAIKELEKTKLKTLVLVFSGHAERRDEGTGFLFGHGDEFVTKERLYEKMQTIIPSIEKIVVFLDCCYTEPLNNLEQNHNKLIRIQVNAVASDSTTYVRQGDGSIFITYIIQCLTKDAKKLKCWNENQLKQDDCKHCSVGGDEDFITVNDLTDYVANHMVVYNKCRDASDDQDPKPRKFISRSEGFCDEIIAFRIQLEMEEMEFILHKKKLKTKIDTVRLDRLSDIAQLQRHLFSMYKGKMDVWMHVPNDYFDIMTIMTDNKTVIYTTVEVMSAWVSHRRLRLVARGTNSVEKGRVGLVLHDAPYVYKTLISCRGIDNPEEKSNGESAVVVPHERMDDVVKELNMQLSKSVTDTKRSALQYFLKNLNIVSKRQGKVIITFPLEPLEEKRKREELSKEKEERRFLQDFACIELCKD